MEGTLAEIRMFGGTFAPRNWALCGGQLLSINSNQALFSLLGTTYGGDGRTTFGLPDFRGRRGVGAGTGPGLNPVQLGQKGGAETHIMTQAEMPAHSHDIIGAINVVSAQQALNDEAQSEETHGTYYAALDGRSLYSSSPPDGFLGAAEVSVSQDLQMGNQGGSQSFNLLAPYNTVYYIICTSGLFPSRS